MKRILAWTLAALLVLALAACGSKTQPELPSSLSSADTSQSTAASTPAADGTTDTAAAETTLPADTTATEAAGTNADATTDTSVVTEAPHTTEAATDAAATTETTAATTASAPAETTVGTTTAVSAETTLPPETTAPPEPETGKTLILYFSCTGTTRDAAERIAALTGGELHEILPEEPYTAADLDWTDKRSRSSVEMRDSASRPAIAGTCENLAAYDKIYLGFPIWWYVAPTIIETFLESGSFAGKTIIPFATSGGSGMGRTTEVLHRVCPDAHFADGAVLNGASDAALAAFVEAH